MRIDWVSKLQHLLQTLAFCLAIATIQYAFEPDKPYAPPVVYSLLIGVSIWVVIDLGRHLLPSAAETGWPTGLQGVLLVIGGIGFGYAFGMFAGDAVCDTFHLFGPGFVKHSEADLRSGILITLMSGIAGTYWFYSRHRSDYLERQVVEVKRHATEARLKLLETQLEPHMLFNTLANLRVLIGTDPARAQAMLDRLIAVSYTHLTLPTIYSV